MRRVLVNAALFAAAASLLGAGTAAGLEGRPPQPAYRPGEILVKFHGDVRRERIDEILAEEGCLVDRVIGGTKVFVILLPRTMDVPQAVERFSSLPEVEYAEPNYRVRMLEER